MREFFTTLLFGFFVAPILSKRIYWILAVFQHETRKEGDIVLEGSNASAEGEDADDGSDPTSVSGIDIVLNHR